MKKNGGVYKYIYSWYRGTYAAVYARNRRCVINENEEREKKTYYNMI